MQPSKDTGDADDLLGRLVDDRYRINRLSEVDRFGSLYDGTDLETQARVGIRITKQPLEHESLQKWLGKAILSRGKDAILAAGHVDAGRFYVVFAEAVLDYLFVAPEPEAETREQKRKPWWQRLNAWRK